MRKRTKSIIGAGLVLVLGVAGYDKLNQFYLRREFESVVRDDSRKVDGESCVVSDGPIYTRGLIDCAGVVYFQGNGDNGLVGICHNGVRNLSNYSESYLEGVASEIAQELKKKSNEKDARVDFGKGRFFIVGGYRELAEHIKKRLTKDGLKYLGESVDGTLPDERDYDSTRKDICVWPEGRIILQKDGRYKELN